MQNFYSIQVNLFLFLITAMFISVPFLLATFLVYAFIRELRVNLHGKSLMCYVFCLTIGYSFLGSIRLTNQHIPIGFCEIIALIIYGSFISSFLWLSVISFDIWWTFGYSYNIKINKNRG